MTSLTSNSLLMMEKSMDFLWVKQAAHLDNIANAETPGYKVKTVSFEEQFRSKLQNAQLTARRTYTTPEKEYRKVIRETSWRVWDDEETMRMDENGGNVTEQALEAVRTAYQIQYVMQAISSDMGTLRRAIGSS